MRIDKLLVEMNYGSRSEIKKAVKNGRVQIDQKVIKDSGFHVDPVKSQILFDGTLVEYRKYVYYMVNKPAGVISATEDLVHQTAIDLIQEKHRKGLFPVGRLDIDTEGLLLITNDGAMAHELLSPKKHVTKTYYAQIDGPISLEEVQQFKQGIILEDGYQCMPSTLRVLNHENPTTVEIKIQEGKFHQIKRMFQAVHRNVVYLKRIAMGPISLDENLETGEYRLLSEGEIHKLQERR